MSKDTQKTIEAKGREIFETMSNHGPSLFNKDWWYGKIMDWSMKSDSFKTQMFRFVDVLPSLNSNKDIAAHLKEYFASEDGKMPSLFNMGVGIGALAPGLLAGTVKKNITRMAKMFITGETPEEAIPVLRKLRKNNMAFTFDILGEACLSEREALEYHSRYLELMDWLIKESKSWSHNPHTDSDVYGNIPAINISVKITALESQIHAEDWQGSIDRVKDRVRPIFQKAKENFIFINIDMEKYEVKDLTIEVFKQLLMEEDFKDYPHLGIVMQAYLRDSYKDLEDLIQFAKSRGTRFSVRLVKGAYWDYETIGAQQKNWPVPVYTFKPDSDINFEHCAELLLQNHQLISLALASHNVRSISHALVLADRIGVPKNSLEVQMLYGMADGIKSSLTNQGYRLREYCPVGELIPGMSYLVRRLLENTSNQSFLKSKFADKTSDDALLADPKTLPRPQEEAQHAELFHNEAFLDFAVAENRQKMKAALEATENKLQGSPQVGYCVNNQWQNTQDTFESRDPSTGKVLGRISSCNEAHAEDAMVTAASTYKTWSRTPVEERAQLLEKVADIFLRDRFDIMALQVLEAGKTWKEADGDVCEAIDFLRYYAQDMRRLASPQKVGHAPGEDSRFMYHSRGVNVVIAPWNFPLAILTGMVGASVVTGNTVVFKPAEQTSLVAEVLMKAFLEAKAPSGVVNMLTGFGETVGAPLVKHKDTAMICFTGSKDVGLNILREAAVLQPGQTHLKSCITELGGKNAIIVDANADLDEAVAGVIYSAFGFQGQKCSACSRVIVLEQNYDRFVDRLVESAKSLPIGPSKDPHTTVGPVIDAEAQAKINGYMKLAEQEGNVLFQAELSDSLSEGCFVPPTIVAEVKPKDRLAQEEIFGPLLAVIKVKSIEEALEVANGTDYALTGAVYSRSPENIERIKKEFLVGNLYINQGSTGALVDRHPFGGFQLSGGGSKTGGPGYLQHFMNPRVVTENTLRRGFAPEEAN